MGYKRNKFEQKGFDETEYQRHFHLNQSEYIRTRLGCVRLYGQGHEFDQVAEQLGLHQQTVRKHVNIYIAGGFERLCQPDTRAQQGLLTDQQAACFKEVLLGKRPDQVGLEGNIWTGDLMRQYLLRTYGASYKSGIYDLLERLRLSHQKAHSDYGNADPAQQAAFLDDLKQTLLEADERTAVVKYDEFSVCQRPTSHYGWAEKNTRPRVVTDEKKGSAPTGCWP